MRYPILILTLLLCLPFTLAHAQSDDPQPDARVLLMDTRLRLRDAPSFSSGTLDGIDPGSPLTLIGRTVDSNWLYIRTPDGL
ncbi:MAG: SH3 domain-containing protein, partial [Chloroflexota bacterium]